MDHKLPHVTRNYIPINGDDSLIDICDDHFRKVKQRRLLRNLFMISLCYFLFYTGFWGLGNLQSTMNGAEGIGDASQATIYGLSMVSSLFLPDLVIGKLGCKKVLFFCTLLGVPYIAANMYLRWDTMILASALYGLINGPFMTSQAMFTDEIATRFQGTLTENLETVMATFFGVLTSFSECTQVLGNVLIYYLLKPGTVPLENSTVHPVCGIHFRLGDNNTNSNLDPPTEHQRVILVGSYVGLGLLSALLIALFLDPLKNDLKEGGNCGMMTSRAFATVKFLKNPYQLLLIPISIYVGMEGPFYTNEVTQAYIACSWGVHHVGFVTICFGVCGALMSILVGPLVKCVSQMAVLIFAACANISMCILLFLWTPTPDQSIIYFVIAGIWGMGDAIWWSQITALYGLMFPNDREAAFSNLYFWSFLGFFISYAYANYLTVPVKINILLAFLITGMLGYLIGQFKIKCTARKEYVRIENEQ